MKTFLKLIILSCALFSCVDREFDELSAEQIEEECKNFTTIS